MKSEERQALKEKIQLKIVDLKEDIVRLVEATQPISPENSIGRISRMDAINNKSINDAALITARQKLTKLEFAASRIDDPSYGFCEQCKSAIHPQRILFMPESSFCMSCMKARNR
ncbi:hypothetical protein N8482_01685 [Chitinophagales bacterium]|nr:hypothetical protein [Chitinophagales bacterium]